MPFGDANQLFSDRVFGIEGLRGFCSHMPIEGDRLTGIKTNVPNAFRYTVSANLVVV